MTESSHRSLVVESLPVGGHRVHVVRDDLLPGGTKERAAVPYLRWLVDEGHHEFVYASPFAGFAQVALAAAADRLGVACQLFCESDPARPGMARHEFTTLAAGFGARIELVRDLATGHRKAQRYAAAPGRYQVPLGFDDERFRKLMAAELTSAWHQLRDQIGGSPRRLWLPVGSGTLANCFRSAIGDDVRLLCVDVRVLPTGDGRLTEIAGWSNAELQRAPQAFAEPASPPPPVPSNAHYDAKLWQFITAAGRDGDVWWNVAR
ncbi:MAG: pyridoxal-phosphate dependent enzyme [Micromonosporaceae bacterium]